MRQQRSAETAKELQAAGVKYGRKTLARRQKQGKQWFNLFMDKQAGVRDPQVPR